MVGFCILDLELSRKAFGFCAKSDRAGDASGAQAVKSKNIWSLRNLGRCARNPCTLKIKIADDLLKKSLPEKTAEFESALITEAPLESAGNQSAAARKLKIYVQDLRYKINKLDIIPIG